jgi:hypothetical protein
MRAHQVIRNGLSVPRFKNPALLIILTIAIALPGCTVRLIGDYDDTIDKGVTDVQQKTELYFAKLESNTSTPYDQSFHDDIKARLVVLESRAVSLPMYSIIAQQITLLQKTFNDFQSEDQMATRPLSIDASTHKPILVRDTEPAVTGIVEKILRLELALKRGDGQAAATKAANVSH